MEEKERIAPKYLVLLTLMIASIVFGICWHNGSPEGDYVRHGGDKRSNIPINRPNFNLWFSYGELNRAGYIDSSYAIHATKMYADTSYRRRVYRLYKAESYIFDDKGYEDFCTLVELDTAYLRTLSVFANLRTEYNKEVVVGLFNLSGEPKPNIQRFARKLKDESYRKAFYQNRIRGRVGKYPITFREFERELSRHPDDMSALKTRKGEVFPGDWEDMLKVSLSSGLPISEALERNK